MQYLVGIIKNVKEASTVPLTDILSSHYVHLRGIGMSVCVFMFCFSGLVFLEGFFGAFLLLWTLEPLPRAAVQAGMVRHSFPHQMSGGFPTGWATWTEHPFGLP